MKKSLRQKEQEATRLKNEIEKLSLQVSSLDGIRVIDEFPVRIIEHPTGDYEVSAGYDGVKRSAWLDPEREGGTFSVTGYRSEKDEREHEIGSSLTKAQAIRAAASFVATGRTEFTPARRGRPAKA